ncbi:hypothetical protein AG0111_0g12078 [Alternaria gaisen]|uniref:Uncharacterized protein n=1 Tax=Alternaria gaisen TaxID=167740 RepID=A0ACB6F5B6_9PLEO|nr:hypothetical protein AG0111_0g12078 [Alternaria gaisen]
MTSQLISTTTPTTQVAGHTQARMVSHLPGSSKRSPKAHVMGILSSIVTMGRLVQTVHDQILTHDAFLTSNAEKFEKAYTAEYHKLLQSTEASKAMSWEIEILRRENAKYKYLEGQSQRLKDDLFAYRTRYRELDESNIRIEKENEQLVDINAEMGRMVVGLRDRVLNLEAKLEELGCQPLCADEDRETNAQTQADVEGESGPSACDNSMSPQKVESPESLPPSLKRRHGELEDEFDSGQEQRKARWRQ